ncbi:MAG: DUF1343 domain-containing protein [Bacteroidales bacterium]|nr:DUF1343 domain-containing protein [Bacteroidales bacterium]
MKKRYSVILLCLLFLIINAEAQTKKIITGAERTEVYLPWIKDKNIAVVVNHTSMIGKTHIVDSLLNIGIKIKTIFSPEHGFKGKADAGFLVNNNTDEDTGIKIISLYSSHKKPTKDDLKDISAVIFDIQDVGVRFYTYISTMTYVMEACAENNILFIILDRPNPNGFYVDGPVLDKKFKSFVGLHPVPVVYGMTIAEYALMVNNEGWLKNNVKCKIKYVKLLNYTHSSLYQLPVKPSPNLPNMKSVYLYPSLCFFEGTIISVGRGTKTPFQIIGHPDYKDKNFSFTPVSIPGASKYPKYENIKCYGLDLSNSDSMILKSKKINLSWLINMYNNFKYDDFFNNYFDKLAGNSNLRHQIINSSSEKAIRKSWKKDIKKFMKIRKKYLLYED